MSGGVPDPATQQQLDDAMAQLGQFKQVIASLESEKQLLLEEKVEHHRKMQVAADELAAAQVSLVVCVFCAF